MKLYPLNSHAPSDHGRHSGDPSFDLSNQPGNDLFAKGGKNAPGSGSTGGGGTSGTTTPPGPWSYTTKNGTITLNVTWDSSVSNANALSAFYSGFETAARSVMDTLSGPIGA